VRKVIDEELAPTEGISMGETIEMINKHSKSDAIMVSDVGTTPNVYLSSKFKRLKVMLLLVV
jgi:hypothetical protein